MALVFKTPEGQLEEVEIVGVGIVPRDGKGGIPVEDAAIPELADADTAAVKAWAESRNLVAVEVKKDEVEALRAAAAPADLWAIGRAAHVASFGVGDDVPQEEAAVEPTAAVESTETDKADKGQKEDRK